MAEITVDGTKVKEVWVDGVKCREVWIDTCKIGFEKYIKRSSNWVVINNGTTFYWDLRSYSSVIHAGIRFRGYTITHAGSADNVTSWSSGTTIGYSTGSWVSKTLTAPSTPYPMTGSQVEIVAQLDPSSSGTLTTSATVGDSVSTYTLNASKSGTTYQFPARPGYGNQTGRGRSNSGRKVGFAGRIRSYYNIPTTYSYSRNANVNVNGILNVGYSGDLIQGQILPISTTAGPIFRAIDYEGADNNYYYIIPLTKSNNSFYLTVTSANKVDIDVIALVQE